MEELSIEEKAQRYDEAIAHAKKLLKIIGNATLGNLVLKNEFKNMFPALEESEDEKIRKALRERIIRYDPNNEILIKEEGISQKQFLAWLEKQGEQKSNLPKWKYKNDNTPLLRDSLILNKYGCVAKSPSGALVSDVWVIDYDELAKLPKEEIEKQGEPIGDTDKVEPKFHEGEWITFTRKDGTREVLQVSDIIDGRYYFNHLLQFSWSIKECNEKCHLWTIQDAKDGDVLAAEDKDKIFIYNGKLDLRGRVCAYCGIYKTHDGLRFTECAIGNYFTYKEPYPATKEQSDTLMKAMADAGYTFDFEKKELKKIVDEEQIKKNLQDNSFRRMFEQKLAWSEEDDQYLLICKNALAKYQVSDKWDATIISQWLENKLKSIKDRYTWKPSQGQLECLGYAIEKAEKDWSPLVTNRIYLTLKALKEQLEKL